MNKRKLQELAELEEAPPEVEVVCAALMHLLAGLVTPKKIKDTSFAAARRELFRNPRGLLDAMQSFRDTIESNALPASNVIAAHQCLSKMSAETKVGIGTVAELESWVRSTLKFHDAVSDVYPSQMGYQRAHQAWEEHLQQVEQQLNAAVVPLWDEISAQDAEWLEKLPSNLTEPLGILE